MKKVLYIIAVLILAGLPSFGAQQYNGTSEAVLLENRPMMTEMYRVRISNIPNGTIEVSENRGSSWKPIGHVLWPAYKVNDQGYTASRWVQDGDIAATAVNAIHIKTDFNIAADRGIIFNIVPIESYSPSVKSSPEASIFTDIHAGNTLFGGGYSPFVGNVVSKIDDDGQLVTIPTGFIPSVGDVFVIKVERPARYPKEIVFENRFGGLISIKYIDGEQRYIGQVLRPVEGVGRFIGGEYADVGRIRAAHAGVIDISLSPVGYVGGFQIIPSGHGMSKEMITARTLTQWMVIGPVSALDPSFEGVAPFFKYYLQPRYNEDDIEKPDWKKRLLERFLVEVKFKGDNDWKPVPVFALDQKKALPKFANTAMEGITHIRILFPIYLK